MTKVKYMAVLILVAIAGCFACKSPQTKGALEIWYGDIQRVGHLGIAQEDFNLLGHVEPWREIDQFGWRLNNEVYPTPVSFRSFRRLARDGDFNIDIPVGRLKPDTNLVKLKVSFLNGDVLEREIMVLREEGSRELPLVIQWDSVDHLQDACQVVDGKWALEKEGPRVVQEGYDRIILIGETGWQNYEVHTSITVHEVFKSLEPSDGGGAVGILMHFTGHTTGGPQHFPSGQPKWGYQPFGGITWLRWERGKESNPPESRFYPGIGWKETTFGELADFQAGKTYEIRSACNTPPDEHGEGAVLYSFKIWDTHAPEPEAWDWQHKQVSEHALTSGGLALIAHHVDATFGDVEITGDSP